MTNSAKYVLQAKGLVRKYGKYTALDNVDFTIEGPTVLAVVGKNGAGKSTLMRIIDGWEKPTSGSFTVNGVSPYDNGKVLRDILFADEKTGFDFSLSLGKILEKCAYMDERFDIDMALDVANKYGLELKKRQSQLSKGMRNQFIIALGLAFNRPITILDEPVSGLDEGSRRLFYSLLVKAQCDAPRIFVITTHLLGEFEQCADTIMVIKNGKIAAYDCRETFETLFVRLSGLAKNVDIVAEGLETFEQKNFAEMKSVTVPDLLSRDKKRFAAEHNVDIRSVSVNDACFILGES